MVFISPALNCTPVELMPFGYDAFSWFKMELWPVQARQSVAFISVNIKHIWCWDWQCTLQSQVIIRSHFLLLEMYAAQITKLNTTHLQPIWLFHTDLSERCMRGCNRAGATSWTVSAVKCDPPTRFAPLFNWKSLSAERMWIKQQKELDGKRGTLWMD